VIVRKGGLVVSDDSERAGLADCLTTRRRIQEIKELHKQQTQEEERSSTATLQSERELTRLAFVRWRNQNDRGGQREAEIG
jgi:hypothetical protein